MAYTVSEKELEDLIYEDLNATGGANLQDKGLGFWLEGVKVYRQVRLGGYGIADLVVIGSNCGQLEIHVLELKITNFCLDHLAQLSRYIKGIKEMLWDRDKRHLIHIYGSIIVGEIPTGDIKFIPNILHENIRVFSVKYNLRGIVFDQLEETWVRKDGIGTFDDIFGKGSLEELYDSHDEHLRRMEIINRKVEIAMKSENENSKIIPENN